MARRIRHNGLLAFPAEAPLTPGTLDQERALPQPYELRAQLTILRLESEKLSDPCVSLSHESSIRSFPTRPHTSTNLSTVPQAGSHDAVVGCWPQMARPVHTCHRDRLRPGKKVGGEVIARQCGHALIFSSGNADTKLWGQTRREPRGGGA